MPHRLDPLLRPRSIAVVGATDREGAVGRLALENLLRGGYAGGLYAVNPGRATACGLPCHASLAALPEPVEHVVFAVADARIEEALDAAITHGARAATLMSSLVLADDRPPPLRERVLAKLRAAGMLACGGNGMGFYNFADGVWACGFRTRDHARGGSVAYISHSGSGMCGIVDVEERIDFNFVVSTGQELVVAMDDYLDFALDMPGTRAIGLFMETTRNPAGFAAALAKANRLRIPVVALKVGRTALSARLAESHSGAIAGADAAYQALFEHYGVLRVADMDELATTLILCAQPHAVGRGGLVSIHDSGGERQLLIDAAADERVPLAALSSATMSALESLLDPGLPAVNPLDAWSTGADSDAVMARCFATLLSDPDAAFGAVVHDRVAGGGIHAAYLDYLRAGHQASGKAAFLVSNRQGTGSDPQVVAATREGFPVLDGLRPFLRAARLLLDWRDFRLQKAAAPPMLPAGAADAWLSRLASGAAPDEHEAMRMLAQAGLPSHPGRIAGTEAEARDAARALGFPVAAKTAMPGIGHKSDRGGVRLGLADEDAVAAAWRDFAARLGPRVLIAPMTACAGVEMLIGMVRDPQFGPLVLLGAGGLHVEAQADTVAALPPFDAAMARRLLSRLRIAALLESPRHARPLAIDAYCEAAARFSALVAAIAGVADEIDLNPVLVHADGCTILDALVIGRRERKT